MTANQDEKHLSFRIFVRVILDNLRYLKHFGMYSGSNDLAYFP